MDPENRGEGVLWTWSRLVRVNARVRTYRYVGPVELRDAVSPGDEGQIISSMADLEGWALSPAEVVFR